MKVGNENGIIKDVNERWDDKFQKTTTVIEYSKKKRYQLNTNLQNFMSLRYDVSYFAPALDIYVTSFFCILILRRDATSFCVAVHPTMFSPSFVANNTVGDSHDAWKESEGTE